MRRTGDRERTNADGDPTLSERIAREQQAAPDRVGAALILGRRCRDEGIRTVVLKHLPASAISEESWRQFVRDSLRGRTAYLRQAAAAAIGRLRWAEATDELIRLLHDRDEIVRVEAVEALWALAAADSCPELQAAMTNDDSWLVRGYAVGAFAALCGEQTVAILEERLKSENSVWVKVSILIALCAAGKSECLPELLRRLHSRSDRVRYTIANNVDSVVTHTNFQTILAALRNALARETTVAAREAIEQAISYIEQRFESP